METSKFNELVQRIYDADYGHEIEWQQTLESCSNANNFLAETCWVILNSGMKEQIARKIWDRIKAAWDKGDDISTVFRHAGKVAAIKFVVQNKHNLFAGYQEATDKIAFLQTIPFIGKITCWHLAKNLGHDCVKPDRHLVRIANQYNTTPDELCERLSKATNYKKATVDIIIWRACNLGFI